MLASSHLFTRVSTLTPEEQGESVGKHNAAVNRGRRNLTGPIATAGLASIALAGAGVMLLLGPDSPTMRSVTADVRLVNTEGPSSDGNSDAGKPPGKTGATDSKPKPKKPRVPSVKQVREHLREQVADATKTLNDVARDVGVKRADGSAKTTAKDDNDENATRGPLRKNKPSASPKVANSGTPDVSATDEPESRVTPRHRLSEIADRVSPAGIER